jgi:iron(III) transport system substrate-binding protein
MIELTRRCLLQACAAVGALSAGNAVQAAMAAGQPDISSLYEAAKKEGAITYYATDNSDLITRVLDGFSARYPGVKVTTLRLATGPMAQRYMSESSAGNFTVDVLQLADPFVMDDAYGKGWLANIDDLPDYGAFPIDYKTQYSALIGIFPHTIVSNTDLVKSADRPTNWLQMLDMRWKGQIILSDPRNNLEVADWAYTMYDAYGADFLVKLRAQEPRFVDSIIPGMQLLVAGEAMLLAPALRQATLVYSNKNAPVSDYAPDLTSGHETLLAVSSKAPHPYAARLLANYLLTREGQRNYCKDLAASPLPDIPGALKLSDQYKRGRFSDAVAKRAELISLLGLS